MIDSRIARFLRGQSFRADLLAILDVDRAALTAITEAFREGATLGEELDVAVAKRIAATTHVSASLVDRAIFVSGYLGTLMADAAEGISNLQDFFRNEFTDLSPEQLAILLEHVENIGKVTDSILRIRNRRDALERGGRTISDISVACDIRLVWRCELGDEPPSDLASADQIDDLLPVAILNVSFADADDGEDCSFQLSLTEVRSTIRKLQAAERQLSDAMKRTEQLLRVTSDQENDAESH